MKTKILAAAIVCCSVAIPANASVEILGVDVDKADICPSASTVKCLLKPNAATGFYIGRDKRHLPLDAADEPDLSSILGKIFATSIPQDTGYCTNSWRNPIKSFAEEQGIDYEIEVNRDPVAFKMKAKSLVDVNLGVDAVAVANAAGVPSTQTEEVAASIKAAYNRVRNEEVEVKGTFRYIQINPMLLTALSADDRPAELEPCAQWLKDNPGQKLMVSVTGYHLDEASVSNSLKSGFSSDIKAKLAGKLTDTQIASVETTFERELEKSAELSFSKYFELLTVGRYPASPL